mmetsp:Transcript_19196/g.73464  ORF Transcript_19196/g.73464 Transcript_19196/m.73464 type:complete len:272 (-) Transcript_19196:430-1245(-)
MLSQANAHTPMGQRVTARTAPPRRQPGRGGPRARQTAPRPLPRHLAFSHTNIKQLANIHFLRRASTSCWARAPHTRRKAAASSGSGSAAGIAALLAARLDTGAAGATRRGRVARAPGGRRQQPSAHPGHPSSAAGASLASVAAGAWAGAGASKVASARPSPSARCGVTGAQLASRRLAAWAPTMSASRAPPPHPGLTAMVACTKRITASLDTRRRSVAVVSSAPPPNAAPCTIATDTCGSRRSAVSVLVIVPFIQRPNSRRASPSAPSDAP